MHKYVFVKKEKKIVMMHMIIILCLFLYTGPLLPAASAALAIAPKPSTAAPARATGAIDYESNSSRRYFKMVVDEVEQVAKAAQEYFKKLLATPGFNPKTAGVIVFDIDHTLIINTHNKHEIIEPMHRLFAWLINHDFVVDIITSRRSMPEDEIRKQLNDLGYFGFHAIYSGLTGVFLHEAEQERKKRPGSNAKSSMKTFFKRDIVKKHGPILASFDDYETTLFLNDADKKLVHKEYLVPSIDCGVAAWTNDNPNATIDDLKTFIVELLAGYYYDIMMEKIRPITEAAQEYFKKLLATPGFNPKTAGVIIFDLDDTLTTKKYKQAHTAEIIQPMHTLFKWLVKHEFVIDIVTVREASEESITKDLIEHGYRGFRKVYSRKTGEYYKQALALKSNLVEQVDPYGRTYPMLIPVNYIGIMKTLIRRDIAKENGPILASFGDQESDFFTLDETDEKLLGKKYLIPTADQQVLNWITHNPMRDRKDLEEEIARIEKEEAAKSQRDCCCIIM